MAKKAIILDLDNTIYDTVAAGQLMISDLLTLVENGLPPRADFHQIRTELLRKPFQVVAAHYDFSQELINRSVDLLSQKDYRWALWPYPDYQAIRTLPVEKFLVTSGFTTLQQSKIRQLGIQADFKQIYIVDVTRRVATKKQVFQQILSDYNYEKTDVVVVGDDLESEIRAGIELGLLTIQYSKEAATDLRIPCISAFSQLDKYIE